MKLCINCRHCVYHRGYFNCAMAASDPSPVNGERQMRLCAAVRGDGGYCGPTGKLYQPTLAVRLFGWLDRLS